ncbi:MAG: NUDIX hydrolase [Anaerolineales bacterium]|nr:MAG: NUDIX hydrolase [Anaerolineales bacterium]
MPEPWPLIRSALDKSYRVFSVRTDTARSPRTGKEHDFYVIESVDWVNVIPLTPDNQVVMVRQYRHGTRQISLEVPGGLVNPRDTPMDTARKELLEETGYQAEEITLIGTAHPQPAVLNNRQLTFLANNVQKTAALNLDEGEDIEVVLVPLSEIPRLIRQGEITNAMVILAFYWYFMEHQPLMKK